MKMWNILKVDFIQRETKQASKISNYSFKVILGRVFKNLMQDQT